MHVGERDVEVARHPVELVVVGDLELDRQRAVGAVLVLADEAVGLQPAGERGLGDGDAIVVVGSPRLVVEAATRTGGDQRAARNLRAVRVQVHAHAELELVDAQPVAASASLVGPP